MAGDRKFETTGMLAPNGASIILDRPEVYKRLTKNLQGKELYVTFQINRQKRSDRQNRWMWGICVKVVQDWFHETQGEVLTPEEVYTWLRISLLGFKPNIKIVMGEEVVTMTGKRFSQMTTKEFSEAVNLIVDTMAQRDCFIPLPNEDNFLHNHVADLRDI